MGVPDEVLKGLAAEVEGLNKPAEAVQMEVEPMEDVEDVDPTPEVDIGDYKTLEEYIEAGGDPEFYRGKKAFEQQKKIIADLKEMKKQKQQLDDTLFKLEQERVKERERHLAQIEKLQAEAKKELDFDEYERLEKQRKEIESGTQPQQGGEPEFIAKYRQENPELNPASPKFDAAHASAFAAMFNAMAQQAEQRAGRPLTPAEASEYLEEVSRRLKPAEKPRAPKVTPTKATATKAKDPLTTASPEQRALYQKWANSTDPKRREFAKKLLDNMG